MIGKNLFRPYRKDGSPVTRKWYRTEAEAKDWGETFAGKNIIIKSKDVNKLVKKRKKTGLKGLLY